MTAARPLILPPSPASLEARGEPAWLLARRRAALARFAEAGLPTSRLEGWRVTPLPEVTGATVDSPDAALGGSESRATVAAFSDPDALSLVFLDGRFDVALSTPQEMWPRGLALRSLASNLHVPELEGTFSRSPGSAGTLVDLNEAAFRDGAWIEVADGARIEREVRLIVAFSSHGPSEGTHVRSLIRLGRASHLSLTIAVSATSEAQGFFTHCVSVSLEEDARLDLLRFQQAPAGLAIFDALAVKTETRATLNDTLFQTGPAWTRSEIGVELSGEGASADLGGVFLAANREITDIHTTIDHAGPGVISRQNYRGLAADEGRGVYHGQIRVLPGARGADAIQNNRNLLLSRRAQVHSTPALEILTDDVKCKHGSATGQIDKAQLFYLRSRGLGPDEATRLLTRAFAGEILTRVTLPAARALAEARLGPALDRLGVTA